MKGSRLVRTWVVGLALLMPAGMAAQEAQRAAPDTTPYIVGQAMPPVDAGSTLVELTLEEAIDRALEQNLDIQAARLDPEIQRYSLRSAQAAFTPTLSTTYGYTDSRRQATSQLDGALQVKSLRQQFNTSLSQTLPWYGGRLSANFNNSRSENNSVYQQLNPSFSSSLNLSYTQPLLAGFRMDNQRASLETQEIQGQITDLRVTSQVERIKAQVRQAYWALRASIEQIEIQRRNLAQAQQLLEDNRLRVRLGRMTEIQLAQSEAQVASAEQALLNAQIQWRNQEFAFKRLLLSGADDPLLAATVNPTSEVEVLERDVDIQHAIDVALENRLDLRQQRRLRDISEVSMAVSRSNTLPDLNLTASYSAEGVGGDLYRASEPGGDPTLVDQGGYFDALRSLRDLNTPTWSLSLSASYPLGTNTEKMNLERTKLQLRQEDLALRSQELAVVTEVTSVGLAVGNTRLQLEAARRSREAAERNLEAELTRFGVGAATNYEVVQAQDDLTSARLSELRALIDHVNAISDFELVQRVGG